MGDRVIRRVVLKSAGRTVAVHRFSANWRPRGFRVVPIDGEFDYHLIYFIQGEQCGYLCNFGDVDQQEKEHALAAYGKQGSND